jgi:phosphatidylinositol alpha-mannosyltransferase
MGAKLVKAADQETAIVGTFHIAPYTWMVTIGNYLLGWWCRLSLRRFDMMLSVSSAAQSFARQTFHIPSRILPNVVDFKRFHDAKPLDRYKDDMPTILFLGRLVPRKGALVLLKAVSLLAARSDVPNFRVVICGKGQQMTQLQRYVADNNLADSIELVGFVSEADKPRYYASADIAVFPSTGGESFGIVLLEAMANGSTAVLAGDNIGYRSVMAPRDELLFDARDAELLATKIAALLTDEPTRTKAAAWGEAYARNFDINVVGAELVEVYQVALRKRRDGGILES